MSRIVQIGDFYQSQTSYPSPIDLCKTANVVNTGNIVAFDATGSTGYQVNSVNLPQFTIVAGLETSLPNGTIMYIYADIDNTDTPIRLHPVFAAATGATSLTIFNPSPSLSMHTKRQFGNHPRIQS